MICCAARDKIKAAVRIRQLRDDADGKITTANRKVTSFSSRVIGSTCSNFGSRLTP
jgi:hypothetical protein